jgi:hypothetical protein
MFCRILVCFLLLVLHRRSASCLKDDEDEDEQEKILRRRRYESWIRASASSWMHPNLTLTRFPEGNGIQVTGDSPTTVGSIILKIPADMQISRQNTLETFRERISSSSLPDKQVVNMLLKAPISEEETMAFRLLWEDCLAESSSFYHYLSILPPQKEMPLLFTFNEEELSYLRDQNLANYAKQVASSLSRTWNDLKPSMEALLSTTDHDKTTCLSLGAFRRFYSIVSSHSMLLDGNICLIPMADSINHKSLSSFIYEEDAAFMSKFADFHSRDPTTGTVEVRTDRTTQPSHQLYEEYDRLDNSLHLTHFGFVQKDNPYHCVVLSILPLLSDNYLRSALTRSLKWDGTACVRQNHTYMPDPTVDLFVAIYELQHKEGRERDTCLSTLLTFSLSLEQRQQLAAKSCGLERLLAHDKPDTSRLLQLPQTIVYEAAQMALRDDPTSLAEDEALLNRLQLNPETFLHQSDADPEKVALALEFRIEDKKLLTTLSTTRESSDATSIKDEL